MNCDPTKLVCPAIQAADAKINGLCAAVLDLARICEAVRFTTGLGKGQMERIERAKALANGASSSALPREENP